MKVAPRRSTPDASPGKPAPLSGTRPPGTQNELEASQKVRQMFSRIAPRYDFLNHLLSLSLDVVWRRRTARRFQSILRRPGARILDLCCGTGDLTLALERMSGANSTFGAPGRVIGSDFALPMLKRAREKTRRSRAQADYLAGDALALPFADASFDLVTAAFGFRNLASYERGLKEMARVLRRGGEVGILEFSEPQIRVIAPIYNFYFRSILPRVGGTISGSAEAYSYLPGSVAKFPSLEELADWMKQAGFAEVRYEIWSCGIVALHTGRRA